MLTTTSVKRIKPTEIPDTERDRISLSLSLSLADITGFLVRITALIKRESRR